MAAILDADTGWSMAAILKVDSGCDMVAIFRAGSGWSMAAVFGLGSGMEVVTNTGLEIISVWHCGNPGRPDSVATGAHGLQPHRKNFLG